MLKLGLKKIVFFSMLILFATSCSSTKHIQSEGRIGIVTYNQYELATTSLEDTSYYVITDQKTFNQTFIAQNNVASKTPDFYGQIVLAIHLKKGDAVKIERATIAGNSIKVYANSCIKNDVNCAENGLTLVTTPRSQDVKFIKFVINDAIVKTIPVKM